MALETKVADIIGKVSLKSDKNLALAGLTIFKKQMQFFLETPLPNKLLDCPVLVVEMEANLVSQTDYAKVSPCSMLFLYHCDRKWERFVVLPCPTVKIMLIGLQFALRNFHFWSI